MRVCFRACLIAILVAGMLNLPAYAANDSPLGMIIQAEGLAHLGPTKAAIGSTVYPGDSVFTETGSTMRLRVGGSQVYLLSESGASLSQGKDMVHVVVSHGTVGFSSPANDPVGLDTPLGFVHPVPGHAAFGQVTLNSRIEMIVTAYHGDLIVEENGNVHTILEGKSYRITTDLEPPAQPSSSSQSSQGSGTKSAMSSPKGEVIAIVGGAALLSLLAWSEFCESPSRMACIN
ncbi:MAG TPA: hypothetical protein VOA88_02395 [Candidatus Dormibacteraeota bacterium]|jgi:hypothetical protein|nr:hypothetical protein [Candidatus Sulfotelmatobacter sp.]HXP68109.1 hypothetical protein [Candidatus Dormibacteraeota bacterium]